jgi:hypothetical protein
MKTNKHFRFCKKTHPDVRVETLDEFLHRWEIERQWQNRYDKQQKQNKRVKCAPAQDAREQIYIQLKG